MDCPILYLASHQALTPSAEEYVKLRRFVDAGGLIFTQADGGGEAFNKFATELPRKLGLPQEWQEIPVYHDLWTVNFRVQPIASLRYVTNGSRILMVHSSQDLTSAWQLRAEKTKKNAFEFGTNLFLYASGKVDLRNRLSSPYLPPSRGQAAYRLKLARIKYGGPWDPEPYAFARFAQWFEYQTGYGINVVNVDAAELDPQVHAVAHLTGTVKFHLNDAQLLGLKNFVERGGTVIIDACGGAGDFAMSAGEMLTQTFPASRLKTVAGDNKLLAGGVEGMEALPKAAVRPYVEVKMGRGAGKLESLTFGHGRVIYSPLDVTTGLLGTQSWGVLGWRPEYAMGLMKNVMLWAADGYE